MRKLKKILSLIIALMMISQTVFATEITKVEKNIAEAYVYIEAAGFNSQEKVNVRILYPNIASVLDGKQNKTIAWTGEAIADENGEILVSAGMPESTDKQVVNFQIEIIKADGTKIPETPKKLVWIDNDGLLETVSNIKKAETADLAMDEITSKAAVLEIQFLAPWYDFDPVLQQEKVEKQLYSKRNNFNAFNDYLDELNYLILQEALYSAKTKTEFYDLLNTNAELIDSTLYDSIYDEMTNETKSDFEQKLYDLRNKLDGEKDTFKYAFKEALLTAYISNLDRSYPLIAVLLNCRSALENENSDMFEIMHEFEAAGEEKQLEICDVLLGERETSLEKISEFIEEGLKPESNTNTGSSGGDRGGKTTTFPVAVNVPAVQEINKTVFADVSDNHYAYESIKYLSDNGVIDGYTENGKKIFNPEGEMTREQFVKMIISAFDFQTSNKAYGFLDVPESSWYAPYVNAAAELGIINGVGENRFGVGEKLTREQMCTIIYRVCLQKKWEFKNVAITEFKDKDMISKYAWEAVDSLKKAGIVSGDTNMNFMPQNNATRANAAKVIHKVITMR